MSISDWIELLETKEQAYARQCFKYWNGTNGGYEPPIPEGMSQSRAEVLKYHVKSLSGDSSGRRKIEKSKPISFRIKDKLKRELAFEAAERDVSISEYIIQCINAGRPLVLAYPNLNFKNLRFTKGGKD